MITLEVLLEQQVDETYKGKVQEALQAMRQMLYSNDNVAHWFENSAEVENYRRRPIPSYLLHPRPPRYLTFLAQSDMSAAFSNIHSIMIKVRARILKGQVVSKNLYQNGKLFNVDVSIMTSANETIRII